MRIWTYPFVKRLKRVCLIITWRELGQSPKGCHSALSKCHSALQKCRIVLLDAKCSSMFGCVLDFFFFFLVLVPRRVFILSLWFFISFMDNSSFFRNNYLVDKYPKINLDKVQIIQNFIVIQSSLLFLCKQSYLRH